MNQQYLEKLNVYFKNDQFWTSLNDLSSRTEYGSLSDMAFSLSYLMHSLKCGAMNNLTDCNYCLDKLSKTNPKLISYEILTEQSCDFEIVVNLVVTQKNKIHNEAIVVYCDNENSLFWADLETSETATIDHESLSEMWDDVLSLLGV